ncbi:hypothetical protein AHEV_235 [Adoxophyes honmai entomopoxvirus 'L']|uniref:Uncharacterized protein n=1 Tax=Adoxophyes honmai entomopoxvirus 'L' TaxID=1293540 RepID=A0A916KP92_9POXV|nr:hypothetical protein AHEV_235 [Adoxophyes honmai entomopoxvirus 'L']CCU55556.1 hypothetical protein AHEV_235 [Adoxophyes honmai entomopoxvirus 'L']
MVMLTILLINNIFNDILPINSSIIIYNNTNLEMEYNAYMKFYDYNDLYSKLDIKNTFTILYHKNIDILHKYNFMMDNRLLLKISTNKKIINIVVSNNDDEIYKYLMNLYPEEEYVSFTNTKIDNNNYENIVVYEYEYKDNIMNYLLFLIMIFSLLYLYNKKKYIDEKYIKTIVKIVNNDYEIINNNEINELLSVTKNNNNIYNFLLKYKCYLNKLNKTFEVDNIFKYIKILKHYRNKFKCYCNSK